MIEYVIGFGLNELYDKGKMGDFEDVLLRNQGTRRKCSNAHSNVKDVLLRHSVTTKSLVFSVIFESDSEDEENGGKVNKNSSKLNRDSKFLHRLSAPGEDIPDRPLELSYDEIEEEFMNLELAQEALQGMYIPTGWPGKDVPPGSPQEAPIWGLMGAS